MKVERKSLQLDSPTQSYGDIKAQVRNKALYKDSIHESKKEHSGISSFFKTICSPFQSFMKWIKSLFSSAKKDSSSTSEKSSSSPKESVNNFLDFFQVNNSRQKVIDACYKTLSDPRLFADMACKIYDHAVTENGGQPLTRDEFQMYLRSNAFSFRDLINRYLLNAGKIQLGLSDEVDLFKKIIAENYNRSGLLGSFEAFLFGRYNDFSFAVTNISHIINTYCDLKDGEKCKPIQLPANDTVFVQAHQKFMKKFAV